MDDEIEGCKSTLRSIVEGVIAGIVVSVGMFAILCFAIKVLWNQNGVTW